jgi:hypothetical protein
MFHLDKQGLVGKSRESAGWRGEEEEALLTEFARHHAPSNDDRHGAALKFALAFPRLSELGAWNGRTSTPSAGRSSCAR